jgi:drug/metabolite transporter (DMT)-like permease
MSKEGFLTLLGAVFLGALGQISIKAGVMHLKELFGQNLTISLILQNPGRVLLSPWILGGFAAYAFSSLIWLTLASRYRLSLIYPMVAMGYVFVVLGSIVVFHDRPTVYTWVALTFIVIGVSLLAKTGG